MERDSVQKPQPEITLSRSGAVSAAVWIDTVSS